MVTLQDIRDARESIQATVKKTPLVRSEYLSSLTESDAYLKLENQQISNSFKIRGALNKIRSLKPEERTRGIISASTGNHAQALAIAAESNGLKATLVVPETTPKVKLEKIRGYKVELILHGANSDLAELYAHKLAKAKRLTFVSAYNDSMVIAGQGTIGLEILEELPSVNSIIVPVSGGGLLAGVAVAAKSLKPGVEVLGSQPEAVAAMYYCLKSGKIINVEMKATIADGLTGNLEDNSVTFELVKKYVDQILLCKEKTIRLAIRLLWQREKQVAEGAGAVAIAPIVDTPTRFAGRQTVAVISGGNIDKIVFEKILASRD